MAIGAPRKKKQLIDQVAGLMAKQRAGGARTSLATGGVRPSFTGGIRGPRPGRKRKRPGVRPVYRPYS